MEQALRAGRMATHDERKIKELIDEVGAMMKDIPLENTPPETGEFIYGKIKEITGVRDPYRDVKKKNIREALSLYPSLKKKVSGSDDPLMTAIRIAIAGNVIDLGVNKKFDLEKDIKEILKQDFATFHYCQFVEDLKNAGDILYIGDNAGESVFDRLLIEQFNVPVTYAVRGIPVINAVTMEDALESGLGEVAELISSGTTAPGAVLRLCSEEFVDRFRKADMVISKGQGNYESLSSAERPVFFLLKAKCFIIARHLGVNENDIVLEKSSG